MTYYDVVVVKYLPFLVLIYPLLEAMVSRACILTI